MKSRLLFVLCFSLFTCQIVNAQLTAVTHEVVYTSGDNPLATDYPEGYSTYRIYAHIGANDALPAVYAAEDNTLMIGTTGDDLWNSMFGSVTGDGLNVAFFSTFPEAEWDSVVTIGRSNSGDGLDGGVTAVSVLPSSTVIPDAFASTSTGEDLLMQDGAWFMTPDNSAAYGQGPENKVLLAQITTASDIEYELNVQVIAGGPGGTPISYVWDPTAATEGSETFFPTLKYPLLGVEYGCTDPEACNYDPVATINDGSCIPSGCMDDTACNFFPEATCDDGSCLYGEAGCTDEAACNFSETAICNMNCSYPGCLDDTACNYDPLAGCDGGNCSFSGCTSINACNYNSQAGCDDGSCLFPDCGDDTACNYNPDANCNNPSMCNYADAVSIQLFQDANENNIWEPVGFSEPALGAIGQIYIPEAGVTIYPDDNGHFETPPLEPGTYTLEFSNPGGNWYITAASSPAITVPSCVGNTVQLGLNNTTGDFANVSGPCCIFLQNIHCVTGFNPGIWVLNTGSEPLNGTVTISFDPLLVPEYHWYAVPYDSYDNGVLTWNINDQLPGDNKLYQAHIQGTDGNYVGEIFPFELTLQLEDDLGEVWSSQTWTLHPEVVCAYDPNDKYAVPEGYAEPNWIVSTEELEYRVRFQNTGNAAAVNVRIEDQLDIAHLDMESFHPLFASHDFTACVTDEGYLTFNFDNIFLPDSATDEPGSQGYVVYRIKPFEDLVHGTEITNTAEIYFDFNEAVVTNTTLHTVMDCESLSQFNLPGDLFCSGEELSLETGTPDYVETYSWQLTGEEFSNEANPVLTLPDAGTYYLEQWVTNPLCTSQIGVEIDVNPAAQAIVTPDPPVCEGELWGVDVETTDSFQWNGLSENEALEITLITEGTYDLTVTTDLGCSWNDSFTVGPFPLPETTFTQDGVLLTADDGVQWQWFLFEEAIDGATSQTYEATESGNYSVEVTSEDGCVVMGDAVFVLVVGIDEADDLKVVVYPNPASDVLTLQFNKSYSGKLRMISLDGREVQQIDIRSDKIELNVSDLASGRYVLRLDNGSNLEFVKK